MRGCVRSCSRRQRRPQHPREPSAGPASARPAAAAAAATAALAAPATVSPKQLPLHGQVNLYDRLLLSFLLLFQLLLLLLPVPSRSGKPLTQLTLARLQSVICTLPRRSPLAALRQSRTAPHFAPATSLGLGAVRLPGSPLRELRPSAPAGQWPPPTPHPPAPSPGRSLQADDAEDALL